MKKQIQLLLIDDEAHKWDFKNEKDVFETLYDIYRCSTFAQAFEMIDDVGFLVDVIILEYNFDDNSLVNTQLFIQKVKNKYKHLPIFLVCSDNNVEKIDVIVDLIKSGADDYLGSMSFSTLYLSEKILASLKKARQNKRIQAINQAFLPERSVSEELSYLHVTESENMVQGSFAYKLNSLIKPKDQYEKQQLIIDAFKWHTSFFNMLVYLLDDDIELTIKYIYNPEIKVNTFAELKVSLVLAFNIKSKNKHELKDTYRQAIHDINIFLKPDYEHHHCPYFFTPLTTIEEVKSVMDVVPSNIQKQINPADSQYKYDNLNYEESNSIVFVRKGIESKENGVAGFKKVNQDQSSTRNLPIPISLSVLEINSFLEFMARQDSPVEFSIEIKHDRLTIEEHNSLIEAGKKAKLIRMNDAQSEMLSKIEGLTLGPDLYNVVFKLKGPNVHKRDNLKTIIYTVFFGGAHNVDTITVNSKAHHSITTNAKYRLLSLYSSAEMAQVVRLPYPTMKNLPGINIINPAFMSLPSNLPGHGVLMGEKVLPSVRVPVKINTDDLKTHSYIIGQTGTGKSTLLFTMIKDLMKNQDCGIGLIDPHGDLYEKVLMHIPDERKDDLIILDPMDERNMFSFNVLDYDREQEWQKPMIINNIIGVLDQMYDLKQTGGPIFLKGFTAALDLAMHHKLTVMDAMEYWQNKTKLDNDLKNCDDERLNNSWKEFLNIVGENSYENISVYFTSKLAEISGNSVLRSILGRAESSISFRNIIDNKKLFICKLPKGKLSPRGLHILGSFLSNNFMIAALSRDDQKIEDRSQFVLFIDEFQNFTSRDLISAFSEARKYNLNLVIANQNLGQLSQEMLHSVLGNVGNLLFFRIGINDVSRVLPYVDQHFTSDEIINLPNYQCFARLNINNSPAKPFVFQTVV